MYIYNKHQRVTLVKVFLTIFCIFAVVIPAQLRGQDWDTTTVDDYGNVGWYTSQALDRKDHPHIAYVRRSSGTNCLLYAYLDSSWQIELVDTFRYVENVSLVLDTSDYAHISYAVSEDGWDYYLKYAFWDGGGWQFILVDTSEDDPGEDGTSITLDTLGFPHIAYCGDNELKYASFNGDSWVIDTIDLSALGYRLSLTLGADDHPHIAYMDGSNWLAYAYFDGIEWHTEIVDSECTQNGSDAGIAIDSLGYPHISYRCWTHDDLKYAYYNGSEWVITVVDTLNVDDCKDTSIALDKLDFPHISYSGNRKLKYAHFDGSSWEIQTIDASGSGSYVGDYSSIALDSLDYPHISYQHYTDKALKYAWWRETGVKENIKLKIESIKLEYYPSLSTQPIEIRFQIPISGCVLLRIYDLTGRLVKTLVEKPLKVGEHKIEWNPKVAKGIYFLKLQVSNFRTTRKITVLK